jgi:5-methylthioribose kinase
MAPGEMVMTADVPARYRVLDEATLPDVLLAMAEVRERLGGNVGQWRVREVSDGNMNTVFMVEGPKGAVVAKQALPYIRVIGESWPFPISRIEFEHAALVEQGRHCPGRVPEVHTFDGELALLVMEALRPHVILRKGFVAGTRYPKLADHIGAFLARTLFLTSDLSLTTPAKKALMARFAGNAELCATTEDVIFTGPYFEAPLNRWNRPHLDALAAEMRADTELKLAATEMKLVFRTATEALLHGDLHTGSIMLTGADTRVIDPEWAFHGPMGFDVGAVLGNLLLAYCSQRGHALGGEERSAYAAWVLETFCAVWERFAAAFLELWRADGDELLPAALFGDPGDADRFRMRRLEMIFEDSLGFAACKMIRRILGISHVLDLEAIPDAALRAECETHALRLARELLVNRRRYRNVKDVVAAARDAASAA